MSLFLKQTENISLTSKCEPIHKDSLLVVLLDLKYMPFILCGLPLTPLRLTREPMGVARVEALPQSQSMLSNSSRGFSGCFNTESGQRGGPIWYTIWVEAFLLTCNPWRMQKRRKIDSLLYVVNRSRVNTFYQNTTCFKAKKYLIIYALNVIKYCSN